jgi:hypothetical protein
MNCATVRLEQQPQPVACLPAGLAYNSEEFFEIERTDDTVGSWGVGVGIGVAWHGLACVDNLSGVDRLFGQCLCSPRH